MGSISPLAPTTLHQKPLTPRPSIPSLSPASSGSFAHGLSVSYLSCWRRGGSVGLVLAAVAEAPAVSVDAEAARRLYVGNIPRTVDDSELATLFVEHGSVEKAEIMYDKYSGRSRRFGFVNMGTPEEATAAAEKLNGSEVGGRKIKVNVTEKPLQTADLSVLPFEDSNFIDSPHKVYVGNIAKTVTSEMLTELFSENGKVLSAKVSRVPGTSKSSGFGFVSFSSEEDVGAAITTFNNKFLEGQKVRVNKA